MREAAGVAAAVEGAVHARDGFARRVEALPTFWLIEKIFLCYR